MSRGTADETTLDLLGDVKLYTGKGARPGDRSTRTNISRSFRLEQSEYALSTVRCPSRDDPAVAFA